MGTGLVAPINGRDHRLLRRSATPTAPSPRPYAAGAGSPHGQVPRLRPLTTAPVASAWACDRGVSDEEGHSRRLHTYYSIDTKNCGIRGPSTWRQRADTLASPTVHRTRPASRRWTVSLAGSSLGRWARLTKSRTEADSDVTPSFGMGMVYVRTASSPLTSMPTTKLRMSALHSGIVPSFRKSRKSATYYLISSVVGSSTLRCSS